MSKIKRIALLTHVLDGGVWSMTRFLYAVLQASPHYAPELILLATSRHDAASVRLLAPATWRSGPRLIAEQYKDYCYQHAGALFSEFEFQRYRPRRSLTQLLSQYDLVQVISGSPAYAAVAQSVTAPLCIFGATTARQDRLARTRRLHGPRKYWTGFMTNLTSRLESAALWRADCVFALSAYTLAQYQPDVASSRLRLAPAGVDVQLFHPDAAYHSHGPLLCVGRLDDPRKNMALLLEAYRQLRQWQPAAPRLVLVSTGRLLPSDEAFVRRHGLADWIDVYVNISHDEICRLYREASLFVLSSDEEGLGIVALEAMASGLPVISTNCGGPATAITPGETGLLTPVGDAPALATAMHTLLLNVAARQRMGQAGRQRAEARFSLEAAGQVFLDAYAELLGN